MATGVRNIVSGVVRLMEAVVAKLYAQPTAFVYIVGTIQ